jgi:small multidrug resistance pump
MSQTTLALLVTVGFSIVGAVGDYFLKQASEQASSLKSPAFYIGFALYASTAFGWVFVMKHLKLAQISVVYSISMVLLLTGIGLVFYRETLKPAEIAGLVMAVGSLILLVRFA